MKFASINMILSLMIALSFSTPSNVRAEDAEPISSNLRGHGRKAYIPPEGNRYLIEFQPNQKKTFLQHLQSRLVAKPPRIIPHMLYEFDNINTIVMTMDEDDAMAMESDPSIASFELDPLRFPMYIDETNNKEQWDIFINDYPSVVREEEDRRRQLREQIPYGIKMVEAESLWQQGFEGEDVTVCVIDTGIDEEHEDFERAELEGFLESSPNLKWFEDQVGHGTHCAGTIGAIQDNKGVVGVAPRSKIYTVKVFGNNGVFASELMNAARRCVAKGSKVISMSLGGPRDNAAENRYFRTLIEDGVLPIAAAGNDGNTRKSYPASYENVISVAAVDESQRVARFSQKNDMVDIAGPGVFVLSTLPSVRPCQICDEIDGYDYENYPYGSISGTSMATPHVAGVAALLFSTGTSVTAKQVEAALISGAQDVTGRGYNNAYGHGIVNARLALNALQNGGGENNGGDDDDDTGDGIDDDECNGSSCVSIDFVMVTNWVSAWQNSFFLTNDRGLTIWDYPSVSSNRRYELSVNVDSSRCYTLQVTDSAGDGIQCWFNRCGFVISFDGVEVDRSSDFDDNRVVKMGSCASS